MSDGIKIVYVDEEISDKPVKVVIEKTSDGNKLPIEVHT